MMIKFYRHYLIYKYSFTFSLFYTKYTLKKVKDTKYKLKTSDKKIIWILREISTFRPFLTFSF